MLRALSIAALVSCFFMCSCKHYCHNNPYPILKFVNFDSSELNTVIVTSHSTTGGCPTCLPVDHVNIYTTGQTMASDTMSFTTDVTWSSTKSDTSYVIPLDFNTDATIYIPAIGRTYTLRGYTPHRDSWESVNCTNSMSYYLNDTLHSQPMQPGMNVEGVIFISR